MSTRNRHLLSDPERLANVLVKDNTLLQKSITYIKTASSNVIM